MAIKILGTNVINDSRQLENITNLKTVDGQSILGTGDITANSGITLLGTITTTSGSSQSLTGLSLSNYNFLYLVFDTVSHNDASARFLLLGQSTSDDIRITAAYAATNAIHGVTVISLATGSTYNLTGNGILSSTTTGFYATDLPISTSSTSISVALDFGSFDNGSIEVYGLSGNI